MALKPDVLRAALSGGVALFLGILLTWREIPSGAERALAAYPSSIRGVPEILVAVSRGVEGVRISVTGRFELVAGSGEVIPVKNDSLAPVRVRSSGGGLAVGDVQLSRHTRLEFRPVPGEEVWLDDVPMPGAVVLTREGHSVGLTAAVELDIEGYTCAAVALRAEWRTWSDETLAAHAIALRTHGLYQRTIARTAGARWDAEESGMTAVLRDGSYRSPRVTRAVNRTRGLVLTWDRRLFPAFMTRSCGGCTEDAARVFTTTSIMPLSGVKCPFCARDAVAGASWQARLSTAAIAERLRPFVEADGSRLGSVRHIEVSETGLSGRAIRLRVETAFGPFDMDCTAFRAAVGEVSIPSALFSVKKAGPELLEFSGRGAGPGVGLCQAGAEQMSAEGTSCVDMLQYYFPGAELARLPYRGREDLAARAGGAEAPRDRHRVR